MAESEDNGRKAKRKARRPPPGWMSFPAAMKHVQNALGVCEKEAHRLLDEAKDHGKIRYDLEYRDRSIKGFMIRIVGCGPRVLAADVLCEFPSKQPEKRLGRKPRPVRAEAIAMAVEKLDQEGSMTVGQIAQWINEWLAQQGDSAANSTTQEWASMALAEHERRRRSL